MLWWLVGMWLASGLMIPVLWLLSVAALRIFSALPNATRDKTAPASPPTGVRALPKRSRMGRFSLAGLVGVSALALLVLGSLRDPLTILHDLALSDAPVPASQAAVTLPPGDADQVQSVEPADGSVKELAVDDPSRQPDEAAPQVAAEWTEVTLPAPPERPDAMSDPRQGHTRRPSIATVRSSRPVRDYFTRSVRGTWLFPPNPGSNG